MAVSSPIHWLWTGVDSQETNENSPVWLSSDEVELPAAAWQFGLSVYTSLAWPVGPQTWNLHWQRLMRDAQAFGLSLPPMDLSLASLQEQFPKPCTLRFTMTAMANTLGAALKDASQPMPSQLWVTTRPAGFVNKAWLRQEAPPTSGGLRLRTVNYERPWSQVKHGNIGLDLIHRRQAKADGFDDVCWVNRHGHLTEASTANLFLWQGNTLVTPAPAEDGCLPGITRQTILNCAQELGIEVRVTSMDQSECQSAQGLFLTNAVQGIRWVSEVGEIPIQWSELAWRQTQVLARKMSEADSELNE